MKLSWPLLALAACAPASRPPEPESIEPPFASLIAMLASDDLEVRARAGADLRRRLPATMPAILANQDHPDPAVRAVLHQILAEYIGLRPLPDDARRDVMALLRTSQWRWKRLPPLDAAMVTAPKMTLKLLIDLLEDETFVPGEPAESQTYTIGSNALALLERLTDLAFDDPEFGSHDHRGGYGMDASVIRAWKAWWEERRAGPVAELFAGLTWEEKQLVRASLGLALQAADPRVAGLGRRTVPYLLRLLVCQNWLAEGVRVCDAANDRLREMTGRDFGRIENHDPLKYDSKDPMRALTRASVERIHRHWSDWWAGR